MDFGQGEAFRLCCKRMRRGLARQIVEGELEGLKSAVKARCTDQTIGRRRSFNCRRACWKQDRHPGIIPIQKTDARFKPFGFFDAQVPLTGLIRYR